MMEWKKAWGYLPIDFQTQIGAIENVTQCVRLWNNVSGDSVKLKFSNRFGEEPLVVSKVAIRTEAGLTEAGVDPHVLTTVTFFGEKVLTLQPGAEAYSDAIPLPVTAGQELRVFCYFEKLSHIHCAAASWSRESWSTSFMQGDTISQMAACTNEALKSCRQTKELFPFVGASPVDYDVAVGLSGVYVETKDPVREITLFGDSITHMSYYADALMRALYQKYPETIAVTNCGYGGNRMLRDASYAKDQPGHGACAGIAGIKRFEQNLYEDNNPDAVFVLLGTNDLMHPYFFERMEELPTVEALCDGLKAMASIAHQHHTKIYFGTVPPMNHGEYFLGEEGERRRLQYNAWIASQKVSDGYFDFAAALGDSAVADRLKEGVHIGDWLHPNQAGGEIMTKTALENCALFT